MVDKRTGDVPALAVWRALGQRLAALLGAATVLYSLCLDVSVLTSVTRGALAWLVISLVTVAGAAAAQRTEERAGEEEKADGATETST
ncbi:MAG: hypothetical protein QF724_08610 [Planctomycetota bacterium]|jgi:predicted aspartyl protease|nr:hypothetical protein [Planctomycetota bacterium]MDP6368522.1 hypothetical protein [Planctomycetota bacterium]MDP6519702.1 hypothetical protein [Planctomycetota bacterium]MDP6838983.1 hypothetical protein [Planctomycetota bacterium]MDP6955856.1 hypothetical protein [Planctomycetota bacterium]